MKANKWLFLILISAIMGCKNQPEKNSSVAHTAGTAPLINVRSNEKVMTNNGIQYAIRYIEETQENGSSDTIPRYMFVIGQRTEQGKNVLEHQASDYELYGRRLNYYNIEIGNDVVLIACGDTLKPVETIYENNLGVIPENRIVAVFEKSKPQCDLQLIFNDRAFENYLIKASFNDK